MSNNAKRYCAITLIIAIVYNVLVFVIPYPHKSSAIFWIAWAFGLLFILVQPFIAYYDLNDSNTLKSKIYGLPILKLGYISLIIQLIITLLFLLIGAFVEIPIWILIILELLLVSFTAIGLLVSKTHKEEVEQIDNKAPLNLEFINNLKIDSEILAERKTPDKIHAKLQEFSEEVKYSDPVSDDSLIEIEDEINRKFIIMKDNILNNTYRNSIDEIDGLMLLLKERNKRAKMNK